MKVRRGSLQDVYVKDGRSVVFVNDQVIVLSEVATAILSVTPREGSVTLAHIAASVVAEVGRPAPPLDAHRVVARQVHDLVAHGVLVSDELPLTNPLTATSVGALRSCLRHALSSDPAAWVLPDDVSGIQLFAAAERHRVTPTIARSSGRLNIPASVSAKISAATRQERATVKQLTEDLARAIDRLGEAGIRCLAFKGLALAVQAHGDVAGRGSGDLDLLVDPRDLERAHMVLVTAGWSPADGYPMPGPSWAWRHFVRTSNELTLVSETSMIDLHWHLGPARSAFPSFDELWARSARVRVAKHDIPTLAPYDALAHSASHAAKDGWHWIRGLLDVQLLAADARTWADADRPLRQDQLLSLGLAARMFGVPADAPAVVHQALPLTRSVWATVLRRQSTGATSHEVSRIPGLRFAQVLRSLRWAGADVSDLVSHVSLSAMPPWITYEETSARGAVAVPRVLWRRTAAFVRRLHAARQSCGRQL